MSALASRRRPGAGIGVALLALLTLAGAPQARADDAAATQIKAAYVLNFLRYTHWPEPQKRLADDAPFSVAVVGASGFGEALREIARQAELLGQRAVQVHTFRGARLGDRTLARLATSHAVFISDQAGAGATILEALRGAPVLTISDEPGFTRRGGMLGLVPDGNRIVFDANPAAIQASGLQVSAKVLKLARDAGRSP